MYFVDLPGYGYAKVPQKEKEKWGKMIENYLHVSKQLQAVFLLIDIRHEPSANDRQMYEWIVYQGFDPVIIATKLDKINRSQVQKQIKMLQDGLKVKPGTPVFPYSALTKQGRDEIWDFMDEMLGFVEEPQKEATKNVMDSIKGEENPSEISNCEENPAKVKVRKKHVKNQEKKNGKKREKKRGKK